MWKAAVDIYKLQQELQKNPRLALVPPVDCSGEAAVSQSVLPTPPHNPIDPAWSATDDAAGRARAMAAAAEDQENAHPLYVGEATPMVTEEEHSGVECVKTPRGTTYANGAAVDEGAQADFEGVDCRQGQADGICLHGEFDNEVGDEYEEGSVENEGNGDFKQRFNFNVSEGHFVDSDDDDNSVGFLEALLVPEDNANRHITYAEYANAMRELDARWSDALSRTLAQSEGILLQERAHMAEERGLMAQRAREMTEQTMEVAVENEERLEELLLKHSEEVDRFEREIVMIKEEALVQTRKLVEEARQEEREKVRKIVLKETEEIYRKEISEIEEAFKKAREKELEQLKAAAVETTARVRAEILDEMSRSQEDAIAACLAKEEEKRTRAVEEAVAAAKKEHGIELEKLIVEWDDKLTQQRESMAAEHEEAMKSLRLESAKIFSDARDAWDKQTQQLIDDHEAAICLVKEEAAKERDEELAKLQHELEKTQMELVGSVVCATAQAEASEKEAQAKIKVMERQLKQLQSVASEEVVEADDKHASHGMLENKVTLQQQSEQMETEIDICLQEEMLDLKEHEMHVREMDELHVLEVARMKQKIAQEQQAIVRLEVEALMKDEALASKQERENMELELQNLRDEIALLQKQLNAAKAGESSPMKSPEKAKKHPRSSTRKKLSVATPSSSAAGDRLFDMISPLTSTPSSLHKTSDRRQLVAGKDTPTENLFRPASKKTPLINSRARTVRSSSQKKNPGRKTAKSTFEKVGVPNSPAMSRSSRVDPSNIRLMVINVPIAEGLLRKMTKALDLEIVHDPMSATHVIAGDATHSIRRTPKFMISLCRTSNILHLDWLRESYKANCLINCTPHLLLQDRKAEEIFSFSMKRTLYEGKVRRQEGGLLANWRVLFCHGVVGRKAPKEKELHMIVHAAGGIVLDYSQLPLADTVENGRVLVITSDPPLKEQTSDRQTAEAAICGAGFFTTTWLFDCVMQQKLSGIKKGVVRRSPSKPRSGRASIGRGEVVARKIHK